MLCTELNCTGQCIVVPNALSLPNTLEFALASALLYRQVTGQCPPAVLINARTELPPSPTKSPRPISVLFPETLAFLDLILSFLSMFRTAAILINARAQLALEPHQKPKAQCPFPILVFLG